MNTNLILKKVELEKTPQNQDFSLRSYLFLTFQNVNTSKCNIRKSEYSNTFNETVLQFKEMLIQILVHTKQK